MSFKYFVLILMLSQLINLESIQAQEKFSSKSRIERKDNALVEARNIVESDPLRALDILSSYLRRNIKSINDQEESEVYQLVGQANYTLGQYDLAIENYQKALGTSSNKKIKSRRAFQPSATIYNDLGQVFMAKGEWTEAINSFDTFLEQSDGNDLFAQALGLSNLGKAYMNEGNIKEALTKAESAQTIIEDNNLAELNITNKLLLGEIYERQGESDKALPYLQEAYKKAEEENDLANSQLAVDGISRVLRSKNDFESELDLKKEVLQNNISRNDLIGQNSANLQIAELYLSNQRSSEAIPYLEQSVDIAEKIGDLTQNIKARKSLSNAYASEGRYNEALVNYQNYVQLVDQQYENKQKEIQLSNEVQQDLFKKQETINLMEKDRALNESQIQLLEKNRALQEESIARQKLLIYGLTALVLVILVSAFLLYRNVNQKKLANQLLALKSLRSQMNPHFIFNALNSVNSFISQNDTRQANKYLSEFSRLMRTVMENSQNDFVSLAEEIETLALYLKLEHFRFRDKFNYEFNVSEDIVTEEYSIPPMLIQPYIENAIWHGLRYKEEQGILIVSIAQQSEKLVMKVEDNGIGRAQSRKLKTSNQKAQKSTGMKNTKDRISLINETYRSNIKVTVEDLDETGAQGTKVTVEIPQELIQEA